ncbi:MAG: hypothetical protein JRJ27_19485 [Deltaproteobacteria bacterium]|nr:hypothetical protein [Deltaproteobacteria bacterium]
MSTKKDIPKQRLIKTIFIMVFIPHPLGVGETSGRGVWGETTCPPKYKSDIIPL